MILLGVSLRFIKDNYLKIGLVHTSMEVIRENAYDINKSWDHSFMATSIIIFLRSYQEIKNMIYLRLRCD